MTDDLYPFLAALADQADALPGSAVTLTVDGWDMGAGSVRVSVSVGEEGPFELAASSDLEVAPTADVVDLLRGGGGHE